MLPWFADLYPERTEKLLRELKQASDIVDGAPDLRDLVPSWPQPVAATGPRQEHDHDDGREESAFPTVRR